MCTLTCVGNESDGRSKFYGTIFGRKLKIQESVGISQSWSLFQY